VPITAHLAVNFREEMNAQTITGADFTLMQGTTPVAGRFLCGRDGGL